MAVIIKEDTDEKFEVELNKGHLKALNDVVITWDFKDKIKALEFAVAVLKITRPGTLAQKCSDYNYKTICPILEITNGRDDS